MIRHDEAECAAVPAPAVLLEFAGKSLQLGLASAINQQTILLVEDEAFVREVTLQVLKSAGYTVLTAKTAAEARRIYDEFSIEIDLLLSDVILPDENGGVLAQDLRIQNPELPILLVTGYPEQAAIAEAEFAAVECLPKPFSARTLLERVRNVLETRHSSAGSYSVTRTCDTE